MDGDPAYHGLRVCSVSLIFALNNGKKLKQSSETSPEHARSGTDFQG